MKTLILILLTSTVSAQVTPTVQAWSMGVSPGIEWVEVFKEVNVEFGPRVGGVWHVNGQHSHFYIQQVIKYKGFVFSPFWLRSFSKSIGYQVPTSIGYEYKNLRVWFNYVYHARSTDLTISYAINKEL